MNHRQCAIANLGRSRAIELLYTRTRLLSDSATDISEIDDRDEHSKDVVFANISDVDGLLPQKRKIKYGWRAYFETCACIYATAYNSASPFLLKQSNS